MALSPSSGVLEWAERRDVLIVEDDPGLQKQMRWSFDAHEVLVAGDRESALVQLRRHEPPVVTLDLGLPPDPRKFTPHVTLARLRSSRVEDVVERRRARLSELCQVDSVPL